MIMRLYNRLEENYSFEKAVSIYQSWWDAENRTSAYGSEYSAWFVLDESEDEGGEMFGDVKVSQLRFPAKNVKIFAK